MSMVVGFVCDQCEAEVTAIARCDCFYNLCEACFGKHSCGREGHARWDYCAGDSISITQSIPVAHEPARPQSKIRELLLSALVPPRDIQLVAVEGTCQSLREYRSTLIVSPTGTGKTVIFALLCIVSTKRVLVIVHRDELCQQAAATVAKVTGEECDIEMGDLYADRYAMGRRAKVVITSVQTMSRERRHQRFNPADFGLVIIDEAHHATAASYRKVIEVFTSAGAKVVGVTATPDRADEEALGQVFESVAFDYQIVDAIRDGWLVPIDQQFVYVEGLDLSACRTRSNDLSEQDLARIMEVEEMLHKVVAPTIELAGDMQTIVFAVSVAQAERSCEIFNRHRPGCAEFICGDTDKEVRRDLVRRYLAGEYQFLCNCQVATEGFDAPNTGVVAIARPTKSRALYCQMVGRGTRPLPGLVDGLPDAESRRAAIAASSKSSVLILDFVGNSGRHKLISTADILGGNESDEVVARAEASAKKKSQRGEKTDMLEEIMEARRQCEEEAKQKRRAIVAGARFGTKSVNPFDVLDITPKREPGWHRGRQPTDKQIDLLEKNGIQTRNLSFWEATQLIDGIIKRRAEGKCTVKQARTLAKYGHQSDVTFEEAKKIIDGIAARGWVK